MDKKFQQAKTFVRDRKNRNVVIATAVAGIVSVAGIIIFTMRGGKTKR